MVTSAITVLMLERTVKVLVLLYIQLPTIHFLASIIRIRRRVWAAEFLDLVRLNLESVIIYLILIYRFGDSWWPRLLYVCHRQSSRAQWSGTVHRHRPRTPSSACTLMRPGRYSLNTTQWLAAPWWIPGCSSPLERDRITNYYLSLLTHPTLLLLYTRINSSDPRTSDRESQRNYLL